jgi:hypothetical protein
MPKWLRRDPELLRATGPQMRSCLEALPPSPATHQACIGTSALLVMARGGKFARRGHRDSLSAIELCSWSSALPAFGLVPVDRRSIDDSTKTLIIVNLLREDG